MMTVSRWERGVGSIPPYLSLAMDMLKMRQQAAQLATCARPTKR